VTTVPVGELFLGRLLGVLGLGGTLLRRRLDWAVVWTLAASVGVAVFRSRLLREFGDRVGPLELLLLAAIVASLAILFGRRQDASIPSWLFTISLAGGFLAIPDTESIALLLGVALALAAGVKLLGGFSGSLLGGGLAGLLLTLVLVDGSGDRAAALVGAAGAACVAAIAPARLLRHLVLVLVWSRLASRAASPAEAVLLGGGFTALPVGGEALWMRFRRPQA